MIPGCTVVNGGKQPVSHVAAEHALILMRYMVDHPDGLSIREASREYGGSPATVVTDHHLR